jgi:hypothetical protein
MSVVLHSLTDDRHRVFISFSPIADSGDNGHAHRGTGRNGLEDLDQLRRQHQFDALFLLDSPPVVLNSVQALREADLVSACWTGGTGLNSIQLLDDHFVSRPAELTRNQPGTCRGDEKVSALRKTNIDGFVIAGRGKSAASRIQIDSSTLRVARQEWRQARSRTTASNSPARA